MLFIGHLVNRKLDFGENCVVGWTSCQLETGFGSVLIVANMTTVLILIHLLTWNWKLENCTGNRTSNQLACVVRLNSFCFHEPLRMNTYRMSRIRRGQLVSAAWDDVDGDAEIPSSTGIEELSQHSQG